MMRTRRCGSVTLLMLGLLTLLLLVGFALFRRLRSHTHTVTLLDQNLVVRNVLESYASDVFQFIRRQANQKGSVVFTRLRAGVPAERTAVSPGEIGYEPTSQFRQLVQDYERETGLPLAVDAAPTIVLNEVHPLDLPEMLYFADAARAVREYQARVVITCGGGFGDRKYSLTAHYPFKVTFVMLPMLREFAWFFDQVHLEQKADLGGEDGLNVLPVKEDEVPAGHWPLVLDCLATEKSAAVLPDGTEKSKTTVEFGEPDTNGKVFLGEDNQAVVLHLAGEKEPTNAMFSELGMVKPSHFNIVSDKADKMFMQDLSVVGFSHQVRGFSKNLGPPVSPTSIRTMSWIFGFSDEISPTGGSLLARSLQLNLFLERDPGYAILKADPERLRRASALKPLGLSKDPILFRQAVENGVPPTEAVGYSAIPARQLFGRIFRRFLMLSFFVVPSCAHGQGEIMAFNPDANYRLVAQQIRGEKEFEPPAGTNYGDFMSKVVSGDPGRFSDTYSSLVQPYNIRPGGAIGQPLTHTDYQGVDGLKVKASAGFDQYRSQMLQVRPVNGAAPGAPVSGLQERISRYYPSGEAFLLQARGTKTLTETSDRFWVGGTVVVDQGLDLSGGVAANDIRGGIVIVNGPLQLGTVLPGPVAGILGTDLSEDERLLTNLKAAAALLEPEAVLTFVVLNGHPITLTGKKYVGVHLVSLHDGPTPLHVPETPFLFFGALALSRPDVARLVRELRRPTAFFYHPVLAVERPPLTVDMDPAMRDYDFQRQP